MTSHLVLSRKTNRKYESGGPPLHEKIRGFEYISEKELNDLPS